MITITGTVKQVAFEVDGEGAAVAARIKLQSDTFVGEFLDLRITNPELVAQYVATQPTADMIAPELGADEDGTPQTRKVFSGAHPLAETGFGAQFSI